MLDGAKQIIIFFLLNFLKINFISIFLFVKLFFIYDKIATLQGLQFNWTFLLITKKIATLIIISI